ncbi:hypothetical protein FBU30_011285 [Linnemannia zychae]|nr:hypothetical protein FBU30_011285 [Linnemannia zychae]
MPESTSADDSESGGKVGDGLDPPTYFEVPVTWDCEDMTTPPSNRPESPTSFPNNHALSPGSPTVRQIPLTNVFEMCSTEKDITGQQDVSPGSGFSLTLSQKEWKLACAVTVKDIDEKWPDLTSILSRVCVPSRSYDDVVQALRKEDLNEPIVDYLRDITCHYVMEDGFD